MSNKNVQWPKNVSFFGTHFIIFFRLFLRLLPLQPSNCRTLSFFFSFPNTTPKQVWETTFYKRQLCTSATRMVIRGSSSIPLRMSYPFRVAIRRLAEARGNTSTLPVPICCPSYSRHHFTFRLSFSEASKVVWCCLVFPVLRGHSFLTMYFYGF